MTNASPTSQTDATVLATVSYTTSTVSAHLHTINGVGFTLVAEQAGCGRELEVLTGSHLALVWLEMGIHEFTSAENVVSIAKDLGWKLLYRTHNCT